MQAHWITDTKSSGFLGRQTRLRGCTHHMIWLASLKTLLAAAQLLIDGHWGAQTAQLGTSLAKSG